MFSVALGGKTYSQLRPLPSRHCCRMGLGMAVFAMYLRGNESGIESSATGG